MTVDRLQRHIAPRLVNDVPPRQTVVRRLRILTVDFDEDTLSIEARHEDVNTMRKAGYLVFRF